MVNPDESPYTATRAHLERFEAAVSNIEARPGERTRLEQLELDAVHAVAEDLRQELGLRRCEAEDDGAALGSGERHHSP